MTARLRVSEAIGGEPAPERLTPQCGPARRVVAAQLDTEQVSARDLDRASAHAEACEPCRAARVALVEARLACRTWSSAPAAAAAPVARRDRGAAVRRNRLAGLVAAAALLLVLLVVALGGADADSGPPAPVAPPVGEGSAEADAEDVVPPPGDEFCLPDAPDCP